MALNQKTIALEKGFFFYDVAKDRFVQLYDGFVFGRIEGNECFPSDLLLSRQHLKVVVESGEVFVEDLETTNRTKVNSNPLTSKERRKLRPNDLVELGNQRFVFTLSSLTAPPLPLTPGREQPERKAERKQAKRADPKRDRQRASGEPEKRMSSEARDQTPRRVSAPRKETGVSSSRGFSAAARKLGRIREWDRSLLILAVLFLAFSAFHLCLDVRSGGLGWDRRHGPWGMGLRFAAMGILSGGGCLWLGQWLMLRYRLGRPLRYALIPALSSLYLVVLVVAGVSMGYYTGLLENSIFFHCVSAPDSARCQELIRRDYRAYYDLPAETRAAIEQSLIASAVAEKTGGATSPAAAGAATADRGIASHERASGVRPP